jgi:hypothetical protein
VQVTTATPLSVQTANHATAYQLGFLLNLDDDQLTKQANIALPPCCRQPVTVVAGACWFAADWSAGACAFGFRASFDEALLLLPHAAIAAIA